MLLGFDDLDSTTMPTLSRFFPRHLGPLTGMLVVCFATTGCSTRPQDQEFAGLTGADSLPMGPQGGVGSSAGESDTPCVENQLRSCAQSPSGVPVLFPGDHPSGNCRYGEQVCRQGRWQPCRGVVAPAPKDGCEIDGDDANCNGTPNEGCSCIGNQGTRPCGISDLGICKMGIQSCSAGSWGACQGEVRPQTEVCDQKGLDEDCDGQADLADSDCVCSNGTQELCTRPGLGDCHLGIRTCEAGQWSACRARFPKRDKESCAAPRMDMHGSALGDEDCDGKVDNTPKGGPDPEDCQFYMVDQDNDGWGALGNDYRDNQDDFTFGCFCLGQVPNPSMVPAPEDQHNKDCGDCQADGAMVNPGVSSHYKEPSTCLQEIKWRGGNFDYNCSGEEDPRYSSLADCKNRDGRCVTTSGDWNDEVPDCGQRGRRATQCASAAPPCELIHSIETAVQHCN